MTMSIIVIDMQNIYHLMNDAKNIISESTNLIKTRKTKNLVKLIIKLCRPLISELEFEEYFQIHFQIIQTLSGIKEAMIADVGFCEEYTETGYKYSMNNKEQIPKLYAAMLFATTTTKKNLTESIITEINTIDNDVQKFLFRYSLITLFPQEYNAFFKFSLENFDEMLIIYAKLAIKYKKNPPATLSSCVVSNISLSLFGCGDAPKEARLSLVDSFVGRSIKIQHLSISDLIMRVILSIADDKTYLSTVLRFFKIVEPNDSRCNMLGNMLLRHNLDVAINAVRETGYYQKLSQRFLQKAIKNSDNALMHGILCECPTVQNLFTVYEILGFENFFENPPKIPKGSEFTIHVLKEHCDAPAPIIKMLINSELDGDRSQELNHILIRLFQTRDVDFTRDVIDDHFIVDNRELYEVLREKGLADSITVDESKFAPNSLFEIDVPKLCESDVQFYAYINEGNLSKIKEIKSLRDSVGSKLPLITPKLQEIIKDKKEEYVFDVMELIR